MKKNLYFFMFCILFSIGCSVLTGGNPETAPTTLGEVEENAETTPLPDNVTNMLDGEPVRLLVVPQKFSVKASSLLMFETDEYSMSVANESQDFIISFVADDNVDGLSLKDLLGQYFSALERRQMVLEYQPSTEIVVNGNQGVRMDFSGQVQEQIVEGSAIALLSDDGWILIGIGMADTDKSKTMWKDTGLPNFDQMVASIEFLDVAAECPISADDTYGYTPENPIKVGGDIYGGASRERAYLDHLLDENGGQVNYERTGSNDFGEVVLDIYVVTTSLGKEAVLYLDMYNFTEPKAPVGFSCRGEFPLSAP